MFRLVFIILILLFSGPATADELVAPLQEGDPAPFAGTLFNVEAAARIAVELENAEAACQFKLDRDLGLQAAQYDLKISNLEAALTTCSSVCDERLGIYQNQSTYFQAQLNKQKSPAWTFIAGVVVGGTLTIGATYAISNILQN